MVAIELGGRSCLVVGGGRVAERKVATLLEHGAELHLIAPEITDGLAALVAAGRLRHSARAYQAGDAAHREFALVVTATDQSEVNQQVLDDAATENVWCNRVDAPGGGPVAFLAQRHQGRLSIGVSTGGASPRVSRWTIDHLWSQVPTGLAELVEALAHKRADGVSDATTELVADGRILEAIAGQEHP